MRREKEAPEHVYFYEKNYKLSTNQRAPKWRANYEAL
jgi:hypothetical protein